MTSDVHAWPYVCQRTGSCQPARSHPSIHCLRTSLCVARCWIWSFHESCYSFHPHRCRRHVSALMPFCFYSYSTSSLSTCCDSCLQLIFHCYCVSATCDGYHLSSCLDFCVAASWAVRPIRMNATCQSGKSWPSACLRTLHHVATLTNGLSRLWAAHLCYSSCLKSWSLLRACCPSVELRRR